jgi:hypothetical protein
MLLTASQTNAATASLSLVFITNAVSEKVTVTKTGDDGALNFATFYCTRLGGGGPIPHHVESTPQYGSGTYELQDPVAFSNLSSGTYDCWAKAGGEDADENIIWAAATNSIFETVD